MSNGCAGNGAGPLLLKSLLHPGEAREAIDRGADGIIVSNHGGRQLDGAVASIRALPGIVEAVGGRAPVLVDGGFRRGVDVVKALALGARAVMIGRPHLWGVACAGEDGVFWVLELLRREIDRALALGGWDGMAKLDRSIFFDGQLDKDRQLSVPKSSAS
jgi:isopentenyl diphosphate isomerase/L-lactate dehydrogenase-like FMN-dependent dehydrogenase